MVDVHLSAKPGKEICDFCSDPNPIWEYPAKDFGVPSVKFVSVGNWSACKFCTNLLTVGNRQAVLQRAIDNNIPMEMSGEDRAAVLDFLHELHGGFYRNQTGPPFPLTKG